MTVKTNPTSNYNQKFYDQIKNTEMESVTVQTFLMKIATPAEMEIMSFTICISAN